MKNFIKEVQKNDEKTIAIDFDGVIHKSRKGFYDGTIYDDEVLDVCSSLEKLSKKYKIIIFTCKANPNRPLIDNKNGIELITEWLEEKKLLKYIDKIVWGKPNAKFYIDDKGIRFDNWINTLKKIEYFEKTK